MILKKLNIHQIKYLYFLAQIIVFVTALLIFFSVLMLKHREGILHSLMAKLETATDSMASQLKANQVPTSSVSGDYQIFIINQTDGSVVIDRKEQTEESQKLWESYRTKLIYEMQKQKRGWIVYPDKIPWKLSQELRIIKYVSIDELHWILAMEAERPTELEILLHSVNYTVIFSLLFVIILGVGLFWFMTFKYFDILKKKISDTVENNFMSLSGEESMINQISQTSNLTQKNEPIELMSPTPSSTVNSFKEPMESQASPILDDREQLLTKKPGMIKKPQVLNNEEDVPLVTKPKFKKVQESPEKEYIQEETKENKSSGDQLTLDVGAIKSPVLKKMIKKFREK